MISVTINGQPLDEKKIYTLASSTFLIEGGDGYAMFKTSKRLIAEESAAIDSAMLSDFISAAGEVSPKVEGRIKRVN